MPHAHALGRLAKEQRVQLRGRTALWEDNNGNKS